MINIRIRRQFDIGKAVLHLLDMVIDYGERYKDTWVGAFDEMLIIRIGIIFDGKQEKAMADAFGRKLDKEKILYDREDKPDKEWYKGKDFYDEKF